MNSQLPVNDRIEAVTQPDDPDPIGADVIVNEDGMATAELLGNAALGIGALVAIWGLLQALGLNVITWMGHQIGIG